jgi:hypothetical protein
MNRDFHDIVEALLHARARFLIVGAHALAVHGVARATADLDIWIAISDDNVDRVWTALTAFGAPLADLGIRKSDFSRPDVVAQFGMPPFRIDVMTGVSGVEFEEAWRNRLEVPFGNLAKVPVIGRAAFVQNKRASGRSRDLADLESLGEAT